MSCWFYIEFRNRASWVTVSGTGCTKHSQLLPLARHLLRALWWFFLGWRVPNVRKGHDVWQASLGTLDGVLCIPTPLTVICAFLPLNRVLWHPTPVAVSCASDTPPLPLTVCCGSDPANRYARNSFSLSHMTSQGHFKTKSWIWIFYFDLLSVLDRIHLKTSVPFVCLVFISNSFVTLFTIQRWSRSLDWTWNPRTN